MPRYYNTRPRPGPQLASPSVMFTVNDMMFIDFLNIKGNFIL